MTRLPWTQVDETTIQALTLYGKVTIKSKCLSPFYHIVWKRQMVLGFCVYLNDVRKGWFESLDHAYRCSEGIVDSNALMTFRRNKR